MMPPLMNNHGNYIVSLGLVCRWLAEKAEALGVEIYPGFAATEVLYNEEGAVIGVATGDMGIEKNGEPGPAFTRGMELHGKYVLIGEGVRGSLAKQLISVFDLRKIANRRNSASASRNSGRSSRNTTNRASCSIPSAGRSVSRPAAARSSIIWRTISSPSASWCISITRTLSLSFRGIPALQDASGHPRHFRGRQAHFLWRARDYRGRLPVGAEADFPRRRADRLFGRFRQCAAHQG